MKDSHNRKIDQETQKRLKSFKKIRKKSLNKQEKLEKLEGLLKKLQQRLIEKGPTKPNLWYIVTNIDRESLQVWAWEELSKREDLEFNEFYEAFEAVDRIGDVSLKEEIFKRALELATPDDLLCLIRFKENENLKKDAWEEFSRRLHKNQIGGKNHLKQILLQVIEHVPGLASVALKEFEKLDPTYQELSEIYNFPYINSIPFLPEKLRSLLRKKLRRKEPNLKIVLNILSATEEIKKLKKGQE